MDEGKNPPAVGVEETGDSVQTADPVDQLAAITAERDQLAAEKADLQDRLLRRQAEFDNFRKRVERERIELLDLGRMQAIESILPVVDDFDRAIKVESADREYARGTELIHQRLQEALKKLGLETIETTGKKFDPNLHHAVDKQPSEEVEEDVILDEYQKGYQYKDKLLRPAMVKVAVRP